MAVTKKVAIILRIPSDLHRQLVTAAGKAKPKRSLNEEMTLRLQRSFDLSALDQRRLNVSVLTDTGEAVVERLEEAVRALKEIGDE
jgi:hypothetical protein